MSTDQLTGLWGREVFDERLGKAIADSDGVALALLDLDYFKELNDTYGHSTGDVVLQRVATALSATAPERAFRLGGDEFALLLPDLTLEEAFLQMEVLRASIARIAIPMLPSGRQVTITIGVAQYPRDASDARELLGAAGAALANAKEGGRDRVSLPPTEKMVMKSCYYPASVLRKLQVLARRMERKESHLLREALDDLFRKYDAPGAI